MEVLYSNHCEMDEKTYGDIYSRLSRKIPAIIAGLLAAAYGAFMIYYFRATWYLVLLGSGLIVEFIFLAFFSSKYKGKRAFRHTCELYHSDHIEVDTLFMDEAFENINPVTGGRLTIEYTQISSVREMDEKYLLILKSRQFICLNKYGFVIGNYLDFEDFIREKCPKARIRLKKIEK